MHTHTHGERERDREKWLIEIKKDHKEADLYRLNDLCQTSFERDREIERDRE